VLWVGRLPDGRGAAVVVTDSAAGQLVRLLCPLDEPDAQTWTHGPPLTGQPVYKVAYAPDSTIVRHDPDFVVVAAHRPAELDPARLPVPVRQGRSAHRPATRRPARWQHQRRGPAQL